MGDDTVQTTLEMPASLHRKLQEAAVREGCSAGQLILRSIERAVEDIEPERARQKISLDPPLVPANGRKPFALTNEQIYELIEFP